MNPSIYTAGFSRQCSQDGLFFNHVAKKVVLIRKKHFNSCDRNQLSKTPAWAICDFASTVSNPGVFRKT